MYSTYVEAQKATQALGIKTFSEYRKRYKADSSLPSFPNLTYKGKGWINWIVFLASKRSPRRSRDLFYKTYEEAQKVVQALGIKTRDDYIECAKENLLLCINPSYTYKGIGWKNWSTFLGTKNPNTRTRDSFYATYEEAKNAVRALGITTTAQYEKDYKNDPCLPSNPNRVYAEDWISWPHFLATKSPTRKSLNGFLFGYARLGLLYSGSLFLKLILLTLIF